MPTKEEVLKDHKEGKTNQEKCLEEISEVLKKYNCRLQVNNQIGVVPNEAKEDVEEASE